MILLDALSNYHGQSPILIGIPYPVVYGMPMPKSHVTQPISEPMNYSPSSASSNAMEYSPRAIEFNPPPYLPPEPEEYVPRYPQEHHRGYDEDMSMYTDYPTAVDFIEN